MKTLVGSLHAQQPYRIALLASRFNELVVKELIEGARDHLVRSGLAQENLVLVRVPGAFELPFAARKLADSGQIDGIVALGCVIRGETAHFDFVAQGSQSGLMAINAEGKVAVSFGVLTVESLDQALARAGSKAGNKGAEAAAALLEQLNLALAIESLASTPKAKKS